VRDLLVLDVGVTTGYALFLYREDTDSWFMEESGDVELEHLYGWLVMQDVRNPGMEVVVELPGGKTRGTLARKLREAEAAVREVFPHATHITPSMWKSSPAARLKADGGSQHQRDAIRIGLWFLTSSG
jgi:hypothetical protein